MHATSGSANPTGAAVALAASAVALAASAVALAASARSQRSRRPAVCSPAAVNDAGAQCAGGGFIAFDKGLRSRCGRKNVWLHLARDHIGT